jgi:hypothetical protein
MQARHSVGIDEGSLSQCKGAVGTFDHEAVLPVQANRRFVVHEHDEFQPQEIQPVVREREGVLQQSGPDAPACPSIVHGHPEHGGMGATRAVGRVDTQMADDGSIRHRHQHPRLRFQIAQALPPEFEGRERHLQRSGDHVRTGVDGANRFEVFGSPWRIKSSIEYLSRMPLKPR